MSDFSVMKNKLVQLFRGEIDFNEFKQAGDDIVSKYDAELPPFLKAGVEAGVHELKVQASGLVGLGRTAIGPILAESTDSQVTMVMNLLQKVGVPTGGVVMSIAERAALTMVITGLKASLDAIELQLSAPPTPAIAAKPVAAEATTTGA